jgi:hypothetical protein
VNDVTQLEHGDGSVLGDEALALVMGKLSPIHLPTTSSPLQHPATTLYGPSCEDVAAGGDAFNGRCRYYTDPEG